MSTSSRRLTPLLVVAFVAARAGAQVIEKEIKESAKTGKSGKSVSDSVSEDVQLEKNIDSCKLDGTCDEIKQADKPYDKRKTPDAKSPEVSEAEENPAAPGPKAGSVKVASAGTGAGVLAPGGVESDRLQAGKRAARTMIKAKNSADALRSTLRPDESPAPDGSAPTGGESRPADAGAPNPGREERRFGEPRSVPEMALAASQGYGGAFRDAGLKVVAGPRGEPAIIRTDGAPASAAELGRLRERLAAEPVALGRRPDFFEVLPREKFEGLKRDYALRPELRATALRDVGMTEGRRDFQWSSSCSGLSGTCNAGASQGSYVKNQLVAPEDLARVWTAAHAESAPEEDGLGEYSAADRQRAAAEDLAEEKYGSGRPRGPNLSSLLAKLGGWGGELSDTLGLSPRASAAGTGAASFVAAPSGARRAGTASGPDAATSARPSPAGAEPPSPEPERGRGRRAWIYALAAFAAGALIVRGVRRCA